MGNQWIYRELRKIEKRKQKTWINMKDSKSAQIWRMNWDGERLYLHLVYCDDFLIPKRYILGYEFFYINNITLISGYSSLISLSLWCLDFTVTFFHLIVSSIFSVVSSGNQLIGKGQSQNQTCSAGQRTLFRSFRYTTLLYMEPSLSSGHYYSKSDHIRIHYWIVSQVSHIIK